jgi:hypothetical protein
MLNPRKGEVMNRFKKLALTATALAALAVGGAAFAQAQNAGSAAQAPTQQSVGEPTSPGDADNVQEGPQGQDGQRGQDHDEPAGAAGGGQETQED